MRLEITVPIKSVMNSENPTSVFGRLLKLLCGFLEKHLGSEILIKVPPSLYDIGLDLRLPIETAEKLQSLGIISKISCLEKFPDEPFVYCYCVETNGNEANEEGADFLDQGNALWKAIREAVGKYLWLNANHFYKKSVRKSYRELGSRALDIFSLTGFSDEQKNSENILKFDQDTNFGWVKAQSLDGKKEFFCPVQLISAKYFRENVKTRKNPEKNEPMLRWVVSSGLATGKSYTEAAVKGILDLIEKDAFTISYLNKISPPIIDLNHLSEQDEELKNIIDGIKRYELEVYLLKLPTDFSAHVILAMVIDKTGKGSALTVGASADFDLKQAILDSLSEATAIRLANKKKYKNDYAIEAESMNEKTRTRYWMDEKKLTDAEFLLKGEMIQLDLPKRFFDKLKDKKYYKDKLGELEIQLGNKKYDTYIADISTKKLRKMDLNSVVVIIPELQPMHSDESLPYFYGRRLSEVPKKTGYVSAGSLNKIPHPLV